MKELRTDSRQVRAIWRDALRSGIRGLRGELGDAGSGLRQRLFVLSEWRGLESDDRRFIIPIGEEELRFLVRGAIRSPTKLFSLRRKNGQSIEPIGEGDAH